MKCAFQVEIDDYANRVLEKHWPDVRRHRDIRTFPPGPADDWRVDVICGGFPCQDISSAGAKGGIRGRQSSLFFEAMRVVRELGCSVVALENVADLLSRGLGDVLEELAALGFDSWWDCVPAAAFGSPQRRWRTFIVSYAPGGRLKAGDEWFARRPLAKLGGFDDGLDAAEHEFEACASSIGGADYGVSRWVDRVACLGNAIDPRQSEWIGRRIVEAMQVTQEAAAAAE